MRVLPLVSIIFGWFFGTFFILIFSVFLLNQASHTKKIDVLVQNLSGSYKPSFNLYSPNRPAAVDLVSAITRGDARGILLDRYFTRYKSPLTGLGDYMVTAADKYDLDYRLLPAIAMKESGLGKVIPKNSYNAWGWAIFTGKNSGAAFSGWEEAIDTVARGIKKNYVDKGLTSPEAIMAKYTPSSDGSWAADVIFTMNQIEKGT